MALPIYCPQINMTMVDQKFTCLKQFGFKSFICLFVLQKPRNLIVYNFRGNSGFLVSGLIFGSGEQKYRNERIVDDGGGSLFLGKLFSHAREFPTHK